MAAVKTNKSSAFDPSNVSMLPDRTENTEKFTPMMEQYHSIKRAHSDCLLFYRMGDFYELFFEDAVTVSGEVDITLTRRGKHQGKDIPMCGVPVHSVDSYLARLIRKGHRVAICEQIEDVSEAKRRRGSKSLVKRDVVRLLTPGTILEDTLLEARENNYLVALSCAESQLGLAWLDMSTGEFNVTTIENIYLEAELSRISPGEILVSENFSQVSGLSDVLDRWTEKLTFVPSSSFDVGGSKNRLEQVYGVDQLAGFSEFNRLHFAACGALVEYLELTQKGRLPHLTPPFLLEMGAAMTIDSATRRNLELVRDLKGNRGGSLLATIDRTITSIGARLLASRLTAPLTRVSAINDRLDMVQYFAEDSAMRSLIRDELRHCPDVERALSRLLIARGGPRDLAVIGDALARSEASYKLLIDSPLNPLTDALKLVIEDLTGYMDLVGKIKEALAIDLPLLARDGGFIAAGYNTDLDNQRELQDQSRKLIAALQAKYVEQTGIRALKVRHNNVLGYFVEVPSAHAEKLEELSLSNTFVRRQTMANAARFSTVELGEVEVQIARASDQALAFELELYDELVAEVSVRSTEIYKAAKAIALLDVVTALAELAEECRFVRPQIDESLDFCIKGGRHPVVEKSLGTFIANDCNIEERTRVWLVTGPNMAGKSTFMRQNALIVILAQMGAYVPATTARLGVVDRLFSRVGASDDLARGRSTFMVEMVETATILNLATSRSFVILDEIGRGTATYDGLSIAWATIEHIHEKNRCRAMFATHYHEMATLSENLSNVASFTMRVREWEGEVVFLYEVKPGTADRSYGIHVAKLAGIPNSVIARAKEVLELLERSGQECVDTRLVDSMPLLSSVVSSSTSSTESRLVTMLDEIDADNMTPREALERIYKLKALRNSHKP